MPPTREIVAESIRAVGAQHLNKFIILFGTVVRTGNVQSRELFKEFACRQCGKTVVCESDISEYNRFNFPAQCSGKVETKINPFFKIAKSLMEKMKKGNKGSPDRGGGAQKVNSDFQTTNCKSRSFNPIEGSSDYSDYQEIKLQELFKSLKPGLIPRSMCVILQNTLVEACKPGDDVMVTGILI